MCIDPSNPNPFEKILDLVDQFLQLEFAHTRILVQSMTKQKTKIKI
jgi:hypothetical protein